MDEEKLKCEAVESNSDAETIAYEEDSVGNCDDVGQTDFEDSKDLDDGFLEKSAYLPENSSTNRHGQSTIRQNWPQSSNNKYLSYNFDDDLQTALLNPGKDPFLFQNSSSSCDEETNISQYMPQSPINEHPSHDSDDDLETSILNNGYGHEKDILFRELLLDKSGEITTTLPNKRKRKKSLKGHRYFSSSHQKKRKQSSPKNISTNLPKQSPYNCDEETNIRQYWPQSPISEHLLLNFDDEPKSPLLYPEKDPNLFQTSALFPYKISRYLRDCQEKHISNSQRNSDSAYSKTSRLHQKK